MQKVRILLLTIAFLALSGVSNNTFAQSSSSHSLLTGLPQLTLTTTPAKNGCTNGLISSSDICLGITETPAPKKETAQPKTQTTPIPTATYTPATQYTPPPATLDADKIFDSINAYRTSQGLAAFEKNDEVCSLAQTRSTEIPAEISNGTLHSGLYNRNLPYWIWENAKYGSDEAGTVAWWLASPLHHESIVGDYKYSCVKCTQSYCSELFTSFVPK